MSKKNQQTPNIVEPTPSPPVAESQVDGSQTVPAPLSPDTSPLPVSNQTTPPSDPNSPVQQNPYLQQAPNTNPNSTQNTLHISEIRDGIVIMNDGSYRSVVMAKSINFDLMSPQEREAVEFSYQGFLNSLYFDIQIYIRSQKIDLRAYLNKLVKLQTSQENMLISLLTEDYIDYIQLLSQQTNIMDKKFYVIIPYSNHLDLDKPLETGKKMAGGFWNLLKPKNTPVITIGEADLEKAKQELKNRVQNVVNGLNQTGVQALPLDTQELIELYYNYYNPDTATRQQLKNFDGFSVPIISKANGQPEGAA